MMETRHTRARPGLRLAAILASLCLFAASCSEDDSTLDETDETSVEEELPDELEADDTQLSEDEKRDADVEHSPPPTTSMVSPLTTTAPRPVEDGSSCDYWDGSTVTLPPGYEFLPAEEGLNRCTFVVEAGVTLDLDHAHDGFDVDFVVQVFPGDTEDVNATIDGTRADTLAAGSESVELGQLDQADVAERLSRGEPFTASTGDGSTVLVGRVDVGEGVGPDGNLLAARVRQMTDESFVYVYVGALDASALEAASRLVEFEFSTR